MSKAENQEIKRAVNSLPFSPSDLKSQIIFLGVFYTLMHVGIFWIRHAIFWDGWVIYRNSPTTIVDTFRQAGAMFNWTAYLHLEILKIGPWFYRFITFFLMFFSGIFFNLILIRNKLLKPEDRLFVVLLFLILPLNFARVSLITVPYAICYCLFFLAWYLSARQRILSLVIFFASFNTNSLLVFYALPILDMLYLDTRAARFRNIISEIFRRSDFLVLPFIYFFIKTKFFPPTGLYAGYHQIPDVPGILANIRYATMAQAEDLLSLHFNPYGFLFMLPTGALAIMLVRSDCQSRCGVRNIVVLALGILATFFAGFPYWVLGDAPTFNGWNSRHQLLFPLGISLIFIAVLNCIGTRAKKIALAIIIAGSLGYGLTTYVSFFVDWNKQKELVKLFSENSKIKESGLIIIKDDTKYLNAINRNYGFYEWNGLLEKAYGNQCHFSVEPNDVPGYVHGGFDKFFSDHYKAKFYERNNARPIAFVEIRQLEGRDEIKKPFATLFPKFSLLVSSVDRMGPLHPSNYTPSCSKLPAP